MAGNSLGEVFRVITFFDLTRWQTERMQEVMSRAKKEGDSLGGIAEVRVTGCPAGLGEPVFDKLYMAN